VEAFEDYVLHAETFSKDEMRMIRGTMYGQYDEDFWTSLPKVDRPNLSKTEWIEFKRKLGLK